MTAAKSSGAENSLDPRFTDRPREPGLDFLRALAIIIVVIYHCGIFGFALPNRVHRFGWIGVDLFFVLSGYLIGGQLLSTIARNGRIDLPRFFARRALRIMPAYFVVLAVYFSLPLLREFPSIPPLWKFLLSIQNLNLLGGTSFSHAWSLAIEDQFYVILPLVLGLIARRPHAGTMIPCSIIVTGLFLRGFLAHLNLGLGESVDFRGFQKWIYYPTWTRLDPLTLGVVLAGIQLYRKGWWDLLISAAKWLWLPALAAIVFGLYIGEENLTVATCVWQFPLIAFGMAGLLVCASSPRLPFSRVKVPGAAFVASIAYSVYLSHKLLIHQAASVCSAHHIALQSIAGLALVQCLIYLGGALLFFAVERPFLQLRHRLTSSRRVA